MIYNGSNLYIRSNLSSLNICSGLTSIERVSFTESSQRDDRSGLLDATPNKNLKVRSPLSIISTSHFSGLSATSKASTRTTQMRYNLRNVISW